MKFSGKNFQSWPNFQLDIEGLTIVIGPSDEGKSGLHRALRGILRNDIEQEHIRNPKNEPLELTMEHDGHTIKATRSKKGGVTYEVDGKEYAKLAGGVPDVIKAMNFGEVKIGDMSFDPIFANQNQPQFLLDSSFKPGEINAILGAFGGTEKLEWGKKQANLRKTQKDSEAKLLSSQIQEAESRKALLELLAKEGNDLIGRLKQLENEAASVELFVSLVDEVLNCLIKLEPIKVIHEVALPDDSELPLILKISKTAEQASFSSVFVKWANKPLQIIETSSSLWKDAVSITEQINELSFLSGIVIADMGEISGFNLSSDCEPLNNTYLGIKYLEELDLYLKEIEKTHSELTNIDIEISKVTLELVEAQKQENIEVCPKCGFKIERKNV